MDRNLAARKTCTAKFDNKKSRSIKEGDVIGSGGAVTESPVVGFLSGRQCLVKLYRCLGNGHAAVILET